MLPPRHVGGRGFVLLCSSFCHPFSILFLFAVLELPPRILSEMHTYKTDHSSFPALMTERHKESPLPTPSPFLGSVYFPSDLVTEIQKVDPKARLFGATAAPPPSPPLPASEQARLRDLLDAKVRGKKVLVCSGGDDKLVPYARSAPLLAVLKDAVRPGGWYEDGGFVLEDRVYEGVGHKFSEDMVRDSVKFLVRIVSEGPRDRGA